MTRSRTITVALGLMTAALGLALAAEAPAPDPKAADDAPKADGVIKGRLAPPERVLDAYLLERSMDLKVPFKVAPKTGEFEVKGLRLGTYDIILRTPWGRLEGMDLVPRLSPYDSLIPPEYRTEDLGLPAKGEFTDADREAVRRIIHEVKRYENKITDLEIRGTADTAVVLVELLMDSPFVGRKGDEITWRIERWYYEKKYDAWTTFRSECLYRYRVSKKVWQTWGWQFEPRLGGLMITDETKGPVVVEYPVPEKPDPKMGLAGDQMPPPPQK